MRTYGASRSRVWLAPNNWSRWNSGISAPQIDRPAADGARGKMTTNRGAAR